MTKKKLWYVETGMGCGLRMGLTKESVYNKELRSIGTFNGVNVVREATKEDIGHVERMGGHNPAKE